MSNLIPMVSSSPPPMDEGGGFDWDDDDDDFGTFTSASDNSFAQSETAINQDSPIKGTPIPDHFNQVSDDENDCGDFANFESQSENDSHEPVNIHCPKNLANDHRPECIHLAQEPVELEEQISTNNESNFCQNGNGPLVDSGVYSSNVSPVQHVDSSGSEKVQVNDIEDNSKATQNETPNELAINSHDDVKTIVEEKNEQFKETINDESSVPKDASLSLTQEKVKVIDESENLEQTDSLKESAQCIPPTDIPENDQVLESGTEKTEEEIFMSHENIDESANVILNCDDSLSKDSDIPGSMSTGNSNSVSSIESQESGSSLHLADHSDEGAKTGIDLPAEHKSDFGDFSSVDQTGHSVKEPVSSVKRKLEESDIVCDVSVIDSNESVDKESIELCNSSSKEEEYLENQAVCVTETNRYPENDNAENRNTDTEGDMFKEELRDNNDQDEIVEIRQNETKVIDTYSESKGNIEDVERTETSDTNVICVNDAVSNAKDSEIKSDISETMNECTLTNNSEPLNNGDDSKTSFDTQFQENAMPVNDTNNTNLDDKQDLGDSNVSVDTEKSGSIEEDDDDFGDFSTTDVNTGDDFGDFNASVDEKQIPASSAVENEDNFGDFNSTFDEKQGVIDSVDDKSDEDFGDFNASFGEKENQEQSEEGFGDFNATFDNVPTEQNTNDWAAFSGPQIAASDNINDEDDDWAGFEEEESSAMQQSEIVTSPDKTETDNVPVPDLAHMTKHEKLLYAVTTCFPALVSDFEVSDLETSELNELHIDSDSHVWGQVKGQNTTDAVSYQWTKSLWNAMLFSTLHIDTRNILIGHKKAPVPVFAAGLTMLEPTKGQAPLKPDVLVDTSKSDSSHSSHSQETIPAAQFDWSSSGLTNPLEANNKTLNLDFLIQDQATKSNALESEFLSTNESPVHKPAIQPLENILANLKTSSTFKPTYQSEDISQEASKVVHKLPDLVFMTSKVLMFPVKLGGFED